jgi:Flp pilus assembly protein TadD
MAAARWAEADAFLRKASACAPRMATIYESLGDLYLQLGRPEEAAVAFRRAEGIEPSPGIEERDAAIPVSGPR